MIGPSLKRKHSIDQGANSSQNTSQQEELFLLQRHPKDKFRISPESTHKTSPMVGQEQYTMTSVPELHEVVDLTESSPELDAMGLIVCDDVRSAISRAASTKDGTSSKSHAYGSSKKPKLEIPDEFGIGIFADDTEYAQSLEAQIKYERQLDNSDDVEFMGSWRGDHDDFEIAAQLQAEFDREDQKAREELAVSSQSSMDSSTDPPLTMLIEYGKQVMTLKCFTCGHHLFYGRRDLIRLRKTWMDMKQDDKSKCPSSAIKCPSCRHHTCAGCRQQAGPLKSLERERTIQYCCDPGRMFMVWLMLGDISSLTKGGFPSQPKPSPMAMDFPGPSGNVKAGVGYGDNRIKGKKQSKEPGVLHVFDKDPTDDADAFQFMLLAALLPKWNGDTTFDQNPPALVVPALNRSTVLEKLARLLRNDAIDNVITRFPLYYNALRFMRVITEHPATSAMAFATRTPYPANESLDELAMEDYVPRPNSNDTVQPLAKMITNLESQAIGFQKQMQTIEEQWDAEDLECQAIQLCQDIISLATFLKANDFSNTITEIPQERKARYTAWHKANAVDEVDDEEIFKSHYYCASGRSFDVGERGRMKTLVMELAKLRAGLPEGVYVRHGSSRLDMMKVLIAGPAGTPYEHGLFEFDVFCPANFPTDPPKVHFKTTGGGVAHFNPNLYPEGKVCLSLIGTWSGEPWRPKTSTLLQVFVSIHSMIFCDEPWCNEPGRENHVGSSASKNYNKTIRRLTIIFAMLDWAKKQEAKNNGLWTEVVETHLRAHATQMMETVTRWVSEGFEGGHALLPVLDDFVIPPAANLFSHLPSGVTAPAPTGLPSLVGQVKNQGQHPNHKSKEMKHQMKLAASQAAHQQKKYMMAETVAKLKAIETPVGTQHKQKPFANSSLPSTSPPESIVEPNAQLAQLQPNQPASIPPFGTPTSAPMNPSIATLLFAPLAPSTPGTHSSAPLSHSNSGSALGFGGHSYQSFGTIPSAQQVPQMQMGQTLFDGHFQPVQNPTYVVQSLPVQTANSNPPYFPDDPMQNHLIQQMAASMPHTGPGSHMAPSQFAYFPTTQHASEYYFVPGHFSGLAVPPPPPPPAGTPLGKYQQKKTKSSSQASIVIKKGSLSAGSSPVPTPANVGRIQTRGDAAMDARINDLLVYLQEYKIKADLDDKKPADKQGPEEPEPTKGAGKSG